MTKPVHIYAGGIDRAGHYRKDRAWLAAKLVDPTSRVVPVWRNQSLIADASGQSPCAVLLAPQALPDSGETVLLGVDGARAIFGRDLSAFERPLDVLRGIPSAEFAELRRFAGLLPRDEAALLAYARGMHFWHSRHRFCAVCGSPSLAEEAGHLRRCTNATCAATHFPRTDPAVIMLIHAGDHCLLGRQKAWMPGMFSTLAGFVEPGESLEEAVAREVREETGIAIADATYHSSQPWPFPSSLMLGFTARALDRNIRLDGNELEDARWFARGFIRDHVDDDGFRLPRRDSIARRLIEDWLATG
jgi:NAD+ diphosphatase